jgi:hypothetical protein
MSSRRPIRPRDIEDPSRIDSNLRNDYIEGNLDDYGVLYRVLVVEIDLEGGNLDRDEEEPLNPPNSFRGRILTRSRDKFTEVEDLPIFWPLFSHDIMPIKEGEHVYALFEDNEEKSHGLWIARIPEPSPLDNVNVIPGDLKFEEDPDNDFSSVGKDQAVQDVDEKPEEVPLSDTFTTEDVPPFTARVGDRVIQGSNNTTIILGRDRPSDVDSGEVDGAGTIDIVAGRDGSEDLSMADDASRIYISMNSDVDSNLDIQVGESAGPAACIALKSDEMRIVARNGMKVVVEGGDMFVNADTVNVAPNTTTEPAVLGDTLKEFLEAIIKAIIDHDHNSSVGPTTPTIGGPAGAGEVSSMEELKSKLDDMLSDLLNIKQKG